jgi:hypothetical protein
MLTIFATPKAFRGHFAVIQRNAIRSWTLLRPACEIILFGDDEGTKAIAAEFGVRHIADVAQTESGTPLVSDLFEKSQKIGTHDTLCYVNCDIILMSDFIRGVQRVMTRKRRFMLVGQRWDLNLNNELDFRQNWQEKLRADVRESGSLLDPTGIDYFVFKRGLLPKIPPFAVGRPGWDNWMIYNARSLRVPVIDATKAITVIHQNHDYSHHLEGFDGVWKGVEAKRNLELTERHLFTTEDATHLLTAEKFSRAYDAEHLCRYVSRLPVLYPWLRLPTKIFFMIQNASRPLRHRLGIRGTRGAGVGNLARRRFSEIKSPCDEL